MMLYQIVTLVIIVSTFALSCSNDEELGFEGSTRIAIDIGANSGLIFPSVLPGTLFAGDCGKVASLRFLRTNAVGTVGDDQDIGAQLCYMPDFTSLEFNKMGGVRVVFQTVVEILRLNCGMKSKMHISVLNPAQQLLNDVTVHAKRTATKVDVSQCLTSTTTAQDVFLTTLPSSGTLQTSIGTAILTAGVIVDSTSQLWFAPSSANVNIEFKLQTLVMYRTDMYMSAKSTCTVIFENDKEEDAITVAPTPSPIVPITAKTNVVISNMAMPASIKIVPLVEQVLITRSTLRAEISMTLNGRAGTLLVVDSTIVAADLLENGANCALTSNGCIDTPIVIVGTTSIVLHALASLHYMAMLQLDAQLEIKLSSLDIALAIVQVDIHVEGAEPINEDEDDDYHDEDAPVTEEDSMQGFAADLAAVIGVPIALLILFLIVMRVSRLARRVVVHFFFVVRKRLGCGQRKGPHVPADYWKSRPQEQPAAKTPAEDIHE